MKLKLLALAGVATLGLVAPAHAAVVVDVDGTKNATTDPNTPAPPGAPHDPTRYVNQFLGQGRYNFTFTQGAFTAHNRFGGNVTGCDAPGGTAGCRQGWETNVRWLIDGDTSAVFKMGDFGEQPAPGPYYSTALGALTAGAVFSQQVIIGVGGSNVNFYIFDGSDTPRHLLDNVGGVSIGIAAVPEPATWAMMIMGFGLIGGAYRSRRTQGTVRFA